MERSVVRNALLGLWVWTVYGLVECIVSLGLPRYWDGSAAVAEWQWLSLAQIFAVYMACGCLVGTATGLLLARSGKHPGRTTEEVAHCLALSLVFACNLAVRSPLNDVVAVALATAAVLIFLLAAALRWDAWRQRTAFLANPWMVSLLLLCTLSISHEALPSHSMIYRVAASLLVLGAIAATGFAWRLAGTRKPTASITRRLAAIAAGAALFIGTQIWQAKLVPRLAASASSGTVVRPNVLLITMDTVRADHLSLYGYSRDTTPNLKRFAQGATVFDRAISPADYTLSSHASIFTGQYPSWHGAYPVPPALRLGRPLHPGSSTLASVLAANHYRTAGIYANTTFLGNWTGLNQGFDIWSSPSPERLHNPDRPFYLRYAATELLATILKSYEFEAMFPRASDINNCAYDILDNNRGGGPLFLFLNYMDAHFPYAPPAGFSRRFRTPWLDNFWDYSGLVKAVNQDGKRLDDTWRSSLLSLYDTGISYEDLEIGKLLAHLRSSGLYDSSLIVITSDHGDAFGEHGRLGHAVNSLYQEIVHVPLIVKYPGQHDGSRSAEWVSLVDIMPTVLQAAAVPLPAGLQGRSLHTADEPGSAPVFTESRAAGDGFRSPHLNGMKRAAFAGSWKLITWSGGSPELYDLAADPSEAENRFSSGNSAGTALSARLQTWTATIPHQRPANGAQPNPAMIRRLKSLGYVQ